MAWQILWDENILDEIQIVKKNFKKSERFCLKKVFVPPKKQITDHYY